TRGALWCLPSQPAILTAQQVERMLDQLLRLGHKLDSAFGASVLSVFAADGLPERVQLMADFRHAVLIGHSVSSFRERVAGADCLCGGGCTTPAWRLSGEESAISCFLR